MGGGKQKSIVLLHFDVPPPNRVTKGVVMFCFFEEKREIKLICYNTSVGDV